MSGTTDIASLIERLRANSTQSAEVCVEATEALYLLRNDRDNARDGAHEAETRASIDPVAWRYMSREKGYAIEPLAPSSALSTLRRELEEAQKCYTQMIQDRGRERERAEKAERERDEARVSAANLLGIISDIREASGLGAWPMLNELAAAIKARIDAARADDAIEALTALKPFADCVFNDNGDMTVSSHRANHDDFVRAYFAIRALAKDAPPKPDAISPQERIAELEKALAPFKDACEHYSGEQQDAEFVDRDAVITVGHLRAARATLTEGAKP